MIEFACHCGHRFSVPEGMSGTLIQCPQCKRLNDVPLLGDLQNLDEDGVYKLDSGPAKHDDPQRIAHLAEAFTRKHFDDHGQPIDFRGSIGEPNQLGEPAPQGPALPKYDPITGELLEEIDVKPDARPHPATIPLARAVPKPPPTAIDGVELPQPMEFFALPIRLLKPANLLVLFFVFLGQLLAGAMMCAIAMLYLLLVPFWAILHALLLSHFANVIDETGPSSASELPTPLRHLDWHDDTFGPFVRAIGAWTICYGPALLMLLNYDKQHKALVLGFSGALWIIGTVLFPAAFLAMTTSGTVLNARPDRLLGVARRGGAEYAAAVFTWLVASAAWIAGTLGLNFLFAASVTAHQPFPAYLSWYSVLGILALGIYLMHLFCWQLGLIYRRCHADFPWVLQRHLGRAAGGRPPPSAFPVQRVRRTRRSEPLPPS